jgi:hypothetical protein
MVALLCLKPFNVGCAENLRYSPESSTLTPSPLFS